MQQGERRRDWDATFKLRYRGRFAVYDLDTRLQCGGRRIGTAGEAAAAISRGDGRRHGQDKKVSLGRKVGRRRSRCRWKMDSIVHDLQT